MLRNFTWLAFFAIFTATATAQTPVSIQVLLDKPVGAYKPITNWFGYDELNYTTMSNGKALLHELHDLSPLPVYIRAHHLLTTGNGVPELKWSSTNIYTAGTDGKPVYDFHIIDGIFDAYMQAGVRPMVELGFMPEALASGTGPYQLHYPHTIEGSVQSPPKDYAAWGTLCRRLAEHLVQRYGRTEAAMWYWEVWNEPDIAYWHGTQAEYNKLYDFAVAGVRAALPEAKVGGPATTSPRAEHAYAFLDAFLKHVASEKSAADGSSIPLDFISFHIKGQPKVIAGHVQMGLDKELTDADRGFALISSWPQFARTPIILSEADPEGCAACSAKENPSNNYRNGTLYSVYTAATIKALFDLQDRHKVNLLGMLTWSFEFEGKDYFQGFRSLATNGIDKPVQNVFRMAGMMSGQRVETTSTAQVPLDVILKSGVHGPADVDAFATLGNHTAAVLLWNYHDDDLPTDASAVKLEVRGLPSTLHQAQLLQFRIDENHSNAYTVWKAMGSPQQPTSEQYAALKNAGKLQSLGWPESVTVSDGIAIVSTMQPGQATSLFVLSW